jgi:DNA invertase Pin-like site-specific DNA recombinase
MGPDALRVGAYLRVSSNRKNIAGSIPQQRDVLGDDMLDHPAWSLAGEFVDDNRSASVYRTRARVDFEALCAAIVGRAFDVLWVWEIQRGSRDVEEFSATLRKLCREHGVMIYESTSGRMFNLDKPRDRTEITAKVQKGEEESVVISERVLRSSKRAARRGTPWGNVAYGYRRLYDTATGALVRQEPHPDRAPVVAEVVARYARHEAVHAIARDLTRRRVETPGDAEHNDAYPEHNDPVRCADHDGPRRSAWTAPAVRKLVTRTTYVGLRAYRGKHDDLDKVLPGGWPSIVDMDDHLAAVARATGALTDMKILRPGGTALKHLLTGIMTCGVCGGRIRVKRNLGTGDPRYACVSHHVMAKVELVDEYVVDVFLRWLRRKDVKASVSLDGSAEVVALRAQLSAVLDEAAEWEREFRNTRPALLARALADCDERARVLREAVDAARVPGTLRELLAHPLGPDIAWAEMGDRGIGVQRAAIAENMTVVLNAAGKAVRHWVAAQRVTVTTGMRVHT